MTLSSDGSRIAYLLGACSFGAVFCVSARNVFLGRVCRSWPVVKGRVLDARTRSALKAPWRATTAVYESVRYTYSVDGKAYDGDNLTYASSTFDESTLPYAATLHMQRYRRDTVVEVHYDPKNPGRSVLEPGVTPFNVFAAAVMLALALVFGWMAILG